MPVHIEKMTSDVTVVDGDLPLTPAADREAGRAGRSPGSTSARARRDARRAPPPRSRRQASKPLDARVLRCPVQAIIEVDARDRGPNLPAVIQVQFNPTEYTLAKGAQIAEIAIPGIDSPILQFVRGQTRSSDARAVLRHDRARHGRAP